MTKRIRSKNTEKNERRKQSRFTQKHAARYDSMTQQQRNLLFRSIVDQVELQSKEKKSSPTPTDKDLLSSITFLRLNLEERMQSKWMDRLTLVNFLTIKDAISILLQLESEQFGLKIRK